MSQGIEIRGFVFAVDDDENIEHDAFLDALIDFVTAHGWQFGGTTKPVVADYIEINDEYLEVTP